MWLLFFILEMFLGEWIAACGWLAACGRQILVIVDQCTVVFTGKPLQRTLLVIFKAMSAYLVVSGRSEYLAGNT